MEIRLGEGATQVIACCPVPAAAPLPFAAVAIDGKTRRGSARCGAEDAHLLRAFSQRLGVVRGQVAVSDKSNEITAIDDLRRLALTGWVVTTDALFTQAAIAQTICDAGGDYLMAVKGNQPTLHDDRALLFADKSAAWSEAAGHGCRAGGSNGSGMSPSTRIARRCGWATSRR